MTGHHRLTREHRRRAKLALRQDPEVTQVLDEVPAAPRRYPRRVRLLIAAGVLGLGYLLGSVINLRAGQDTAESAAQTAQSQTQQVTQQRDSAATNAQSLGSAVAQSKACQPKGGLAPDVCNLAGQVATNPIRDGKDGQAGKRGLQGKPGVPGQPGPKGDTGPRGEPGPSASSQTFYAPDGSVYFCTRSGGTATNPTFGCTGGPGAVPGALPFPGSARTPMPVIPRMPAPPRTIPHRPVTPPAVTAPTGGDTAGS